MQKSYPQYRINYRFCHEKDHTFQKANLVCMQKQCIQNSLICSFCLEEKHQGHLTKPLKHFLENLQKTYSNSSKISIDFHLKQLEQMKIFLFDKIRQAVQKLATGFLQLEEEVMRNYELIKHQIIEKESKQNRFKSFYHSMAFQGKQDPNFQLQNYLNFQSLNSFNLTNGLDSFIAQTSKNLQEIKRNLIRKSKEDYQLLEQQTKFNIISQSPDNFIIPSTIIRTNDVFSQQLITSKQTVGYLNTILKNWTGKMRIKVINLDAMANLTIGIAKLEDIADSKHIFPLKNSEKTYFINSKGVSHNQSCNFITDIKKGDNIDITLKKNKCKVLRKGDLCHFQAIDKQSSVFFFSLDGACEIQILYPYKKA